MPKIKSKSANVHIGVDPGKSGGIVLLQGMDVEIYEMPDTELDTWRIFQRLKPVEGGVPPAFAMIEKVHSMPKQGVASSFTFGRNYGFLRACLIAAGVPFQEISPQQWQKALDIPPKKKEESKTQFKDRLRSVAQQMFPSLDVWHGTLGLQRSVCDALLIAEVCRRKYEGK